MHLIIWVIQLWKTVEVLKKLNKESHKQRLLSSRKKNVCLDKKLSEL